MFVNFLRKKMIEYQIYSTFVLKIMALVYEPIYEQSTIIKDKTKFVMFA